MGSRWHHSGQKKTEAAITSSELRALAANGLIRPEDLVCKEGSEEWIAAARVEGLFRSGRASWYFMARGKRRGPVTTRQLRKRATDGKIGPDDLVWRAELSGWKEAGKIIGLLPADTPRGGSKALAPLEQGGEDRNDDRRHKARGVGDHSRTAHGRRSRDGRRAVKNANGHRPTPGGPRDGHPWIFQLALAALAIVVTAGLTLYLKRTPGRQDGPANEVASESGATPKNPREDKSVGSDRPVAREGGSAARPLSPAIITEPLGNEIKSSAGGPARRPAPVETRDLGAAIHDRIKKDYAILDESPLRTRILSVARELMGADDAASRFRFSVLDSDEVKSFSHVGGYVYVSRGLFALIANDIELSWVIGHEIAHVELEHDFPEAGPDVVESAYRRILTGRQAKDVFAADARIFRILLKKYTSRQSLTYLRRYREYVARDAPGHPSIRPPARDDSHGGGTGADAGFEVADPAERVRRLEALHA